MAFSKEDQYKYSVVEIAESIHGSVCGSGPLLSEELLEFYLKWLEWRTGEEGWTPSSIPRFEAYEEAVWSLARRSADEARKELECIRSRKAWRSGRDAKAGSK